MKYKSKLASFSALTFIMVILSFTSGCIDDRAPVTPTEIDRPTNLSISPTEGELAIPIDGTIEMEFDEGMELSTFTGRFILTDSDSNIINGSFSKDGFNVIFTPTNQLEKSTIYYSSLLGGVKDENNNTIQFNSEAIFSDTIEIAKTWFFTEGDYSEGGFYNVYLRDRKQGKVYILENLSELGAEISSLSAPDAIAISENGSTLIISNTAKNEVLLIDLNTNEILKTFIVAQFPSSVIVYNNLAYILSINGKQITVIDLINNDIVSKNDLSFFPGKLTISSDGEILYTIDQVNLDLVILNSANFQIIKRISKSVTGGIGGEITFDPISEKLFICDSRGKKVKVTNKQGDELINYFTPAGGLEPRQISINGEVSLLAAGDILFKLGTESAEIIDQKKFAGDIKSIAIIPSGDLIYVTLNSSVHILDFKTLELLKEIELGVTGLESIIAGSVRF